MKLHHVVLSFVALTLNTSLAFTQGSTAFNYQGRLRDAGALANGTFNVDFGLWDDPAAGNQVGATNTFNSLPILEGIFTVELDFGASAFDNNDRWLEITVDGMPLVPRQTVTRTPYAIQTRGIFVNANNNVGIGTSTPLYPLHVESDGESSIVSNSQSTSGRGVVGVATASTGSTYGGHFRSFSTSGRGVYGEANASTGITDGVFGLSNSTSGRGICGWAPASSGTTYGVFGTSDSTSGAGVSGEARATSGSTYGVSGYSHSESGGIGVYGEATGTAGTTWGVFGKSNSTFGRGVFGDASANTGATYGVFGRNNSSSGTGVYGRANASTGINYGVVGHSNSSSGFDFYASGAGVNYGASSSQRFKSNVVPISDPLDKLAQLRGVYFDWDDEHGGLHDVGMIAEEVGGVMPEIVQYEENGVDAIGMDYSKMTPLLVEAVNALRAEKDAEIARQQVEIANLAKRLDRMEAMLKRLVEK